MNDSYTAVVIENETGVTHVASEWECIKPTDDEHTNAAALYKVASVAIAAIVSGLGTSDVTVTVMTHEA